MKARLSLVAPRRRRRRLHLAGNGLAATIRGARIVDSCLALGIFQTIERVSYLPLAGARKAAPDWPVDRRRTKPSRRRRRQSKWAELSNF